MADIRKIEQILKRFQDELDATGADWFLFIKPDQSPLRVWSSSMPNDAKSSFHYIRQAVDCDQTNREERGKWRGVKEMENLKVICINNIELEAFLSKFEVYEVVKIMDSINGFAFILKDSEGEIVTPPAGFDGFHSSRFEQFVKMDFAQN